MKSIVLLLPLLALCRAENDAQNCGEVQAKFNECTKKAHKTYSDAIKKGDDGRKDFVARKSCNYLEDAIENCANHLTEHDCNSEEEVTDMKDHQIKSILTNLNSSVQDWDSCKCPTVKAHIDRVKTAEGAETEECPEPEPEPEGETGGSLATTTISLATITTASFFAILVNHV